MINSQDIMEEANSVKVLAFMEIAPLTDKFQQIVLNREQAKEFRDALFKILTPQANLEQDKVMFNVMTNDKVQVVLTDVRDYYGEAFIKAAVEVEEAD